MEKREKTGEKCALFHTFGAFFALFACFLTFFGAFLALSFKTKQFVNCGKIRHGLTRIDTDNIGHKSKITRIKDSREDTKTRKNLAAENTENTEFFSWLCGLGKSSPRCEHLRKLSACVHSCIPSRCNYIRSQLSKIGDLLNGEWLIG